MERRRIAEGAPPASRIGVAGSYGIEAKDVERAYHELGVNYFFVVHNMPGLVEGVRNLVKGGHRDRMVIVSGAKYPFGVSVSREFAQNAKATGVDQFDVFHLFWIQADWYVTGKTWPAMQRLKAEGKAKALAVSCHDRKRAVRLVTDLSLDVLMIRYNAAHRGAEREIFPKLPERRPAIVAYTATRWGKLLQPKGGLGPMTGPECYRFALSHPAVDVVLCGAGSFEELAENVRGLEQGPLSDARLEEVRKFGDAVRSAATGRIGFVGS